MISVLLNSGSKKELAYMEKHLDEYKSYDTREDLKKALLSDD